MRIISGTHSLCPSCEKRVEAFYIQNKNNVTLKKICPDHGSFETVVWRGDGFEQWNSGWEWKSEDSPNCPKDCGICENHINQTCCAILDITNRCNLRCPICFADGGQGWELSLSEVKACLDDMYNQGLRFIHISGGEPTVHPDFLKIIAYASEKGFSYIQVNTNGVKLAEDPDFAMKLDQAGASCVFLQFDGISDEIYEKIRGRKLLDIKLQAIEHCDKAQLGVVLVPTLIPGINDRQIGSILRFARSNAPAIRGVHFQPVTYMGRYFAGDHLTIPELLDAIEEQTEGDMKKADILPSTCDAPLCGFHGEFNIENGKLIPLTDKSTECCCGSGGSSLIKNQFHVKNRWSRVKDGLYPDESFAKMKKDLSDKSFCISGMMFQDLTNIDLGRVMKCSVHVYKKGKLIPFCIYHNRSGYSDIVSDKG